MKEFLELQKKCLDKINTHICGNNCVLDHFCVKKQCELEDCSECLYHIQHGNPTFHYSCKKITYHYTLRFFNRFASEITYILRCLNYDNITDLNVVSLGCGPGTEIYGIIKTFLLKECNTILHYEGHDINSIWESVQTMSKECLKDYDHEINFYKTDLFADFHGFKNDVIDLLIFNYLLSDAVLFMTNSQKLNFIFDIVNFIIENKVKNILFNDISYYGDIGKLNSGVQLMKLLIQILNSKEIKFNTYFLNFPGDNYLGDEDWKTHQSNNILLSKLKENTYMDNIEICKSKQIFIQFK